MGSVSSEKALACSRAAMNSSNLHARRHTTCHVFAVANDNGVKAAPGYDIIVPIPAPPETARASEGSIAQTTDAPLSHTDLAAC